MKRAGLLLLALAGCAPSHNPNICSPLYEASELHHCLHKWAYRLAPVAGPVQQIARATVGGCSDLVAEAGDDKPPTPSRPLEDQAYQKALFFVTQARAGHCKAP